MKTGIPTRINQGIATLPTVVVIGLMALAVVVSITSLSLNELLTSQGQAQSTSALFYAEGGARDALIKIARNKNYVCSSTDCYSVDFVSGGCSASTDCARITVSSGIGTSADPKIITSKGVMKASTRTIQVTVLLDGGTTTPSAQNGEITSATWTEVTN
jgi:hypothetical protein